MRRGNISELNLWYGRTRTANLSPGPVSREERVSLLTYCEWTPSKELPLYLPDSLQPMLAPYVSFIWMNVTRFSFQLNLDQHHLIISALFCLFIWECCMSATLIATLRFGPFIPFIQEMFTDHTQCAEDCLRCLEYIREYIRQKSL